MRRRKRTTWPDVSLVHREMQEALRLGPGLSGHSGSPLASDNIPIRGGPWARNVVGAHMLEGLVHRVAWIVVLLLLSSFVAADVAAQHGDGEGSPLRNLPKPISWSPPAPLDCASTALTAAPG